MFSKIIDFIFNSKKKRDLKRINNIIDHINILENCFSRLSDSQLKKKLKFLKTL